METKFGVPLVAIIKVIVSLRFYNFRLCFWHCKRSLSLVECLDFGLGCLLSLKFFVDKKRKKKKNSKKLYSVHTGLMERFLNFFTTLLFLAPPKSVGI